jgi:hypothetical protein
MRTMRRFDVLFFVAMVGCAGEGTLPVPNNEATQLAFITQPSTVAAGSAITSLQVALRDANGDVVADQPTAVTIGITAGSGASGAALTGTVSQTTVSGIATFDGLGIQRAGSGYSLTASASGVSSATTGSFNIMAGAASKLAIVTQPANVAAGTAITPGVQVVVQDAFGNLTNGSGSMVAIGVTAGSGAAGATLSGTQNVSTASGSATFSTLSIDKAAAGYTLTASSAGLTSITTASFAVSPGAAAMLSVMTQPSNVAAGSAIAPSVQVMVRDAHGNTVTSSTANVGAAIAPGSGGAGATLSGTVTRAASGGIASFSDLSIDMIGSGYALNLTSAGLTAATTSAFNVTAAGASKLAFSVQPSGAAAGSAIAPAIQVRVTDAGGNTVTSALSITSGSGAGGAVLGGTVTRTAVAGVATFDNLSVNKSGSGYTLDASATSLTSARSSAFTIAPGAAAKLAFTIQPSGVAQTAAIAPAVRVSVRDANDNTVTSATNSVTLAITGGTGTAGAVLGGTVTRAAVSGVATFDNLSVDLAGTGYTLTATAGSLPAATSTAFSVTATVAGSCASPLPDWIFCDDFDIDRFASYFEVDTDGSSMARVAGVGRNGSSGIRSRFTTGQVSAGSLKLAFGRTPDSYFRPVDAGTQNYREIYWRVYVRNQAGWVGGGGDKLTRLTIFANNNWAQAMIAHVWSGSAASNRDYLLLDPASGTDVNGVLKTTTYNDFANLRWLSGGKTTTALFSSANVGQWYCVEAHVKLNTAGQSDGVFDLKINGQLEVNVTGMNWVGNYSTYGLNAILLESYWNAGSPANQERYFDDFVVSKQPIGC